MSESTSPYALVVDDNVMVLMHACDILEEAGFRFYEASTGDAAAELLNDVASNVTLLFTDVEMPGVLDGFALARLVSERWSHIEIVVASGGLRPEPGDLPDRAIFIGKPFDASLVHDHLRRILPDGKQPAQLKKAV
ncbi:response regulator [Novosphingobium sp. JCM 18896]|uniref:response regulator n=1 Tax=Novosphingobium sp. JCM 18896 TaxID=2989731 RepID=UPI002223AD01|nr:response regulator [Novosphingobium sp. JCM 18896]MCW1430872.1 response regulator [Novosphingobium sp. JCM 18896]